MIRSEEDAINLLTQQNYILSYEDIIEVCYKLIKNDIENKKASKNEKKRWHILNQMYRDSFLSKERIHLFKTCTGSGKSVTSIMWAKYLTTFSFDIDGFVVLSPEYEHGTYDIERSIIQHGNKVDYLVFEGKNRICKNLEKTINKKGTKIKELVNKGISINNFCENECKYRKQCKYFENCDLLLDEKSGIKNWIGVQHQLNAFLPIYLMNTNGKVILVIDEDFSDAIKSNYRHGVKLLRKNLDFLKKVLKIEKSKKTENEMFIGFVEYFIQLIEHFLDNLYTFMTPIDYDLVFDIFIGIDVCKGTDDYYIQKLNEHAFSLIRENKIEPFEFIYPQICNFIDNVNKEFDENESLDLTSWMRSAFYKIQNSFLISYLYYDKFLLDKVLKSENLFKIIINDATADPEILSYILGDLEKIIEHNEDWLYERCEFNQLRKSINRTYNNMPNEISDPNRNYAHYPKSSLLHKSTFYFLMNDLRAILERHPKEQVLVVSRDIDGEKIKFNGGIDLSVYVHTLGHPKVVFEDYPLSGTNEYADYNVVVLLGKPDLPNTVIKRQSTLIGMEQQKYRFLYSKNLMKQAMGRIFRGYENKYVYILSGFNLGIKRPIISYKGHSDLQYRIRQTIKKEKKQNKGKELLDKVLMFTKSNGFITTKNCEDYLGLSKYKARKLLDLLVNKNILKLNIVNHGARKYLISNKK